MNRSLSLASLLAVSLSCSVTPASPSSAPLVAQCAAGDYRSDDGGFCAAVPKGVNPEPGTPRPGLVVFHPAQSSGHVFRVYWAEASDKGRSDDLRKVGPMLPEGTFEVLHTEKVPGGSFSVTHDATQRRGEETFKSPTVQGVMILETPDRVVRCEAVVSVTFNADPRTIARNEATFLESCRSLRLLARGAGKGSP